MFPDIELALTDWLVSFVADSSHVGTYTGPDLGSHLPYIRVNRFGGGDDGVTDHPAVDIDFFGSTRAQAVNLARTVHASLIAGPHRVGAVLLDLVSGDAGPHERPWNGGTIRRFGGTYTFSARRIPA